MNIKAFFNDIGKSLQDKYRLVLYNDSSFAEVVKLRLTRINIFAYLGFFVILIIGLSYLLFSFTPLKYLIPYDPNEELQRDLYLNMEKLDSIEQQIAQRDQYLQNQISIYMGRVPADTKPDTSTQKKVEEEAFEISEAEMEFRQKIEREERHSLAIVDNRDEEQDVSSLHFVPPVTNGMITNRFNMKEKHIAVDIVAEPDAPILSVLEGTVFEATWTLQTGYVIQVQHKNDLISIYKHNSSLLKEVGQKVDAGENIAIIGNTGELTTGPHLHFELWHKGTPLNPEDYIRF